MNEKNIMERAFELAGSGDCRDMRDLQVRLKQEGYTRIPEHLGGSFTSRQINTLIKSAAEQAAE
ncbi:MAG: hypothetical protein ACK4K7_15020 [Allosphingosinicella sp.]|uniref:hypothetical protein n=1 Tax=Allosphingosinicella sp. TaxID=2823234 RepID=UPI003961773E